MTEKQTPDQRQSSLLTNWLLAIPLFCLAVAVAIYSQNAEEPDKQFILGAIISFTLSLVTGICAFFKKEKLHPNTAIFILFFAFFFIGQGLIVYKFLRTENSLSYLPQKRIDITAYMSDKNNSSENKVKTVVVYAWGDHNPDISIVKNDEKISEYKLGDGKIFFLTHYLNIAINTGDAPAHLILPTRSNRPVRLKTLLIFLIKDLSLNLL